MLKPQRGAMSNFDILLAFLKGDKRVPDSMRWYYSTENKITAMKILRKDVLEQIPKCLAERKRIEKKGMAEELRL